MVHMSSLGKRAGALLHRLIKAMASKLKGGAQASGRLHTNFNRLSSSPTAAMEVSAQLKQVFQLIDANGDGKISPSELGDVLLRLGHERGAAAREAEGMVREVDCDGDGLIDLDEFMEVVDRGETSGGKAELLEAFRVFDADGNGFISAEELRRVLVGLGQARCSLRECRLMIRGVDRNGDGLVDFDEFWCMMTSGECYRDQL